MQISTVIFDFAGVVSTEQLGGWKKIADKFGLDPEKVKERYYTHVEEYGRGGVGSTQRFLKNVLGESNAKLDEFRSLYSNWWKLNEDVISIVEKLKKNYTVVLFSDNFDASTPSMRADKKLNFLFPQMFFSNEMGTLKEEESSFRHVLESIGKNAEECVFIDDKEKNLVAPAKIGIRTLLFKGPEQLLIDLKNLGVEI